MNADLQGSKSDVVPDSASAPRFAVGVMTGTSLDGIDAVLVRTTGSGLAMQASIEGGVHAPIGPAADTLTQLSHGAACTAAAVAHAAHTLGEAIANVVTEMITHAPDPTCVAVHGQTVHH
ncbi:MAG: anhydro-N-acetylmuramic acid kinase, partial [Phycisphaerales bacterium]|nr:anhydro-N-acetylmuramic acid kinase [Phycisphaerales bacterium]